MLFLVLGNDYYVYSQLIARLSAINREFVMRKIPQWIQKYCIAHFN